jgi:putative tryptophan/tyrosine transport system substrate-binding protein
MRRRDFTMGLLLATAVGAAWAQEPAKEHRIAIIRGAGPAAIMRDTGDPLWHAFFEELRLVGDVEGQTLIVERYSGEGKPESYADLARDVVSRSPNVTVALGDAIARAVRAANGAMPIVWVGGDPIEAGLATSLARPGGTITGVTVYPGAEIWGKRLQILKEAVPSMSKVAYLDVRSQLSAAGQEERRKASRRLQISLVDALLEESTPSEVQRVFAEITQERTDAVMVSGTGDLLAYRQLILELVEKSRLPAIYGWRQYVEAGGLMAYAPDPAELGRRLADDVHEILNGTEPGQIPIYQPTKFEFLINLKAAKALGLNIPSALLALADEVIE